MQARSSVVSRDHTRSDGAPSGRAGGNQGGLRLVTRGAARGRQFKVVWSPATGWPPALRHLSGEDVVSVWMMWV